MLSPIPRWLCFLGLFSLFALVFSTNAFAFTTNMNASVVIGQPNFSSSQPNAGGVTGTGNSFGVNSNEGVTGRGFDFPYHAMVFKDKLIVGDYNNYRYLIYNSIPTANNASADLVIGQTDFNSRVNFPGGVSTASSMRRAGGMTSDGTNLVLADYSNHRVLIFNTFPTSNYPSADVEIGQTTFTSGTTANQGGTPDADTVNFPWGVEYHKPTGKLYISDFSNNRILIFNQTPRTNNASADGVLGQANFTTGSINRGQGVGPTTLEFPDHVRFIGGKMIIADDGNNRVLIWNTIPTTSEDPADVVIGQPDMASNAANQGGRDSINTSFVQGGIPGPNKLAFPQDVAYFRGEFFVVDRNNDRVLIFNGIPTTNNASAYKVLGQPNMASNTGFPAPYSRVAANTLHSPAAINFYKDKLIVNDVTNHRILIYDNVTKPLDAPPVVTTTATSATVVWQTKTPMTSIVEYGADANMERTNDNYEPHTLETLHKVALPNLSPCTVYYYRVTSTAGDRDNIGTMDDATFTTAGNCTGKDVETYTVSLKAEIAQPDLNVARSYTPITFTVYTPFTKSTDLSTANSVQIAFVDGKRLPLSYVSEKNALGVWQGTYRLPVGTRTAKLLTGNAEFIHSTDLGKISFSFDPTIPGLHVFDGSEHHTFKAYSSSQSILGTALRWLQQILK